jgi:hypothetical protein
VQRQFVEFYVHIAFINNNNSNNNNENYDNNKNNEKRRIIMIINIEVSRFLVTFGHAYEHVISR